MADKDIEKPTGDAASAATPAESKPAEAKNELPVVESPPLSPAADPAPALSAEIIKLEPPAAAAASPAQEPEAVTTASETPSRPRFAFNPLMKRHALLAASVALAAALGAVFGALATGPAKPDVATLEERKAMQQSIARLFTEITALKGNLSERLKRESAEITGSIAAPQTVAAAPAPALNQPQAATPLPQPRPLQRVAAVEPHRPVVAGWTIHDVRDGYVYVQGYGDIYRVTPGAPLPGLGPVESIKRQDGRWTVVTPKGVIVAGRDRRYFDSF